MASILCFSDSIEDIRLFAKGNDLLFFKIRQLPPQDHSFELFESIYKKLRLSTDLGNIDLVIAEYIESLPLLFLMREDSFACPAIIIPHTNPYPLNILSYCLLIAEFSYPDDVVICGSANAVKGYQKLVNMKALDIATFGVKDIYGPRSKSEARARLGLPRDGRFALYTGRYMPDKGISRLLDAYEVLKKIDSNITLIISMTHIASQYFNKLAPRQNDAVLFYRLARDQMPTLYNSADVYVSAATSIFETYGKSPLEAITCGVPVVVPRWDGFPHYINNENGSFADVVYGDTPVDTPYSFAQVDIDDFVDKCRKHLEVPSQVVYELDDWAYYSHTMKILSDLVSQMLSLSKKSVEYSNRRKLDYAKYPNTVCDFLSHYRIQTVKDLRTKTSQLIAQEDPGDTSVLKALHDELFQTMIND